MFCRSIFRSLLDYLLPLIRNLKIFIRQSSQLIEPFLATRKLWIRNPAQFHTWLALDGNKLVANSHLTQSAQELKQQLKKACIRYLQLIFLVVEYRYSKSKYFLRLSNQDLVDVYLRSLTYQGLLKPQLFAQNLLANVRGYLASCQFLNLLQEKVFLVTTQPLCIHSTLLRANFPDELEQLQYKHLLRSK